MLHLVFIFLLIDRFNNVITAAIASLVAYFVSYYLISKRLNSDPIPFSIDKGALLHILQSSTGMALIVILVEEHLHLFGAVAVILGLMVSCVSCFSLVFAHLANRIIFVQLIQAIKY